MSQKQKSNNKQQYVTTSVKIYSEQKQWLEKNDITLSPLVRGIIERINHLEEYEGEKQDTFTQMYQKQFKFNKKSNFGINEDRAMLSHIDWEDPELDEEVLTDLTKTFLLHIEDEAHEVLNELSWKDHKPFKKGAVNREDLLEELVDIQKFLFCVQQLWGFTSKEIEAMFYQKSAEVEKQYEK